MTQAQGGITAAPVPASPEMKHRPVQVELDGSGQPSYLISEGKRIGLPALLAALASAGFGAVPGLTYNASAAALANINTLQSAANASGSVAIYAPTLGGKVHVARPLLVGNRTHVHIDQNAELYWAGPATGDGNIYLNNLIRFTNVCYDGIVYGQRRGVLLICATEDAVTGSGTLRFVFNGTNNQTTVAYKAPGDTTFGTAVTISALNKYRLVSGNGTSMLWIMSDPAALYNGVTYTGTIDQAIFTAPVTGAKAMTYTVASGFMLVHEVGHGRQAGDTVEILEGSGSNTRGTYQVLYVPGADYYAVKTALADNATPVAGWAWGTYGWSLTGEGSLNMDYRRTTGTVFGNYSDQCMFGVYYNGASRFKVRDVRGYNARAHFFHGTNLAKFEIAPGHGENYYDYVHINGPARNGEVHNIHARTSDNLNGIGTTDYSHYISNLPTDIGNGTLDEVTVREAHAYNGVESVRWYGDKDSWIRNCRVIMAGGYVSGIAEASGGGLGDKVSNQCMSLLLDQSCVNSTSMKIDGLTIKGFSTKQFPTVAKPQIFVNIQGSAEASTLRNLVLEDVALFEGDNNGSLKFLGPVSGLQTIDSITLRNCQTFDSPYSVFQKYAVFLDRNVKIKTLRVESAVVTVAPSTANSGGSIVAINANVTCSIDNLVLLNCIYRDVSNSGAGGNGAVVYVNAGAVISNLHVIGGDYRNFLYLLSNSGTTTNTVISDAHVESTTWLVNGSGTYGSLTFRNLTGSINKFYQINSAVSQTIKVRISGCSGLTTTANPVSLNSATQIQLYAPELQMSGLQANLNLAAAANSEFYHSGTAGVNAGTVSAITNANPGVVTVVGTMPSNGDIVTFSVSGITLAGTYQVGSVAGQTFRILTLAGANVDTTSLGTFTSGTFSTVQTYAAGPGRYVCNAAGTWAKVA